MRGQLWPIGGGGGTKVFPDGLRSILRLRGERRFANGMAQVTYERSPHR